MSVPIMPLSDYVVVVAEEAENKTASGLFLPEAAKEKPKTAKVVAVGKGVSEVKVSDRIIYKNEYDATTVKSAGKDYVLVDKKNIIATIK